jgi:hypothetical protein
MSFMDKIKKANIVRVGGISSTYKNNKDRPMSLQDDMFIGNDNPSNSASKSVHKERNKSAAKQALIICCLLTLIFISLSLATTISWVMILVWVSILSYFWLVFNGSIRYIFTISMTFLLVITAVISFTVILVTQSGKSDDTSKTSSSKNALTSEQCRPYKERHDGQILKISSDGLQGTIGIKIDDSSGCKLKAYYNVLLSYALPVNPYKRDIGPVYNYVVLLRSADQTTRDRYDGYGVLSAAYKNQTLLPDPFATGRDRSSLYSQGVNATETRYFYWGYEIDTDFSEARYQEILDHTKLEIVDGLAFIEEDQSNNNFSSWSINTEKATVGGPIVKSYVLTIE